jgi:hypothetical protein
MKAITIKNCGECPIAHLTETGNLYCDSAAVCDRRKKKDRFIGNFVTDEIKIPDWCPLTNMGSQVMAWLLDNKIRRKDISKPIHDLILKTE